ncbi:hypothetical protein PHLCEN_2v13684 [Hermanssonia centrifuga]|nr:hypothetical protein PHLCEN_2v13684 [Hermanssonia centrifuga]
MSQPKSDYAPPDTSGQDLEPPSLEDNWIAIEPPSSPSLRGSNGTEGVPPSRLRPPSFESAQFDVVLRRQRQRPSGGGGVKFTAVPSRFLNLVNTFEFSGWGTMTRMDLNTADLARGDEDIQNARRAITLGQYTASALAGNAVLGSVFYALPAVIAVSGV